MSDSIPSDTPQDNHTPKTTYIYILRDPETNAIRYVGKADNLEKRLQRHLQKDVDSHRSRWVNSLKRRGLKPVIELVEEVPYDQWPERERYWIARFRAQGCDLTNTATGGNGGSGPVSPEVRAKISAANKGRKFPPMSEETRRKMSESRKGRKNSPEAIAKTAAALRGRKASPETRAKLSMAHKGQIPTFGKGAKHTPETRAKMSLSKRQKRFMRENPPDSPTLWN
jgi:hypothetical protein